MTAPAHNDCHAKRHGDESAYNWWGCRCPQAREAWRIYKKRLREGRHTPRRVEGIGTTRRIQALVAFGYDWRAIGRRLDLSPGRVRDLGQGRHPIVLSDTRDRVAAVYSDLSLTPGPSKYALVVARRYGYEAPAAWDDDTIDDPTAEPYGDLPDPETVVDWVKADRALDGHPVELNPRERHFAVHAGQRRGMTHNAIALAIGMSLSTARVLAAKPLPEDCEVAA